MLRVLMLAVLCGALAFTAAVAPTSCASARAASQRNNCIRNLMMMREAKADWAKAFGITNLDVAPEMTMSNMFGWKDYRPVGLRCPEGGKYWAGRLGDPPRCSILGHTFCRKL